MLAKFSNPLSRSGSKTRHMSQKLRGFTAVFVGVVCLMLLLGAASVSPALAADGCFRQRFDNVEVYEIGDREVMTLMDTGITHVIIIRWGPDDTVNPQVISGEFDACQMSGDDAREVLETFEGPVYLVTDPGDDAFAIIGSLSLSLPDYVSDPSPPTCWTVLRYHWCK